MSTMAKMEAEARLNIKQSQSQCDLVVRIVSIAKQDAAVGRALNKSTQVKTMDMGQNLCHLHLGSDQIGPMYYLSPKDFLSGISDNVKDDVNVFVQNKVQGVRAENIVVSVFSGTLR